MSTRMALLFASSQCAETAFVDHGEECDDNNIVDGMAAPLPARGRELE